ncbi:MAG: hypothetical protein ACPL3Q_03445, partial [Candidatus Ratteibacteria bacterium]
MEKQPKIDGKISEFEWKEAIRFDGFCFNNILEPRRCIGFIGATDTKIYVAVLTEKSPEIGLLTFYKENTEKIIYDDAISIWIDPHPEYENGNVYKMICNSSGFAYYSVYSKEKNEDVQWYGKYIIKNGLSDKYWHCEIEIPVNNIEKNRKTVVGQWKINIVRNFKQPSSSPGIGSEFSAFVSKKENIFTFSNDKGIIVREKHLNDPFSGDIDYVCELYNPLKKQVKIETNITLKRRGDTEGLTEKKELMLQPGDETIIGLKRKDTDETKFWLETGVKDIEKNEILFQRGPIIWKNWSVLNWKEPEEKWLLYNKKIPGADFMFSYYPYLNKMKILVQISNVLEKTKVDKVNFKIKNIETGKTESEFNLGIDEFKNGMCEKFIDLPPLSGKYKIAMKVKGENVPEGEIVKK